LWRLWRDKPLRRRPKIRLRKYDRGSRSDLPLPAISSLDR